MIHDLPLERRTTQGRFDRDLASVVSVAPGDSVSFQALNAGWRWDRDEEYFERDRSVDGGHALAGPIEVKGARAGATLLVRIDEVVPREWGVTFADGEAFHWQLDGDMWRLGQHAVVAAPFLGVIGMPGPERGRQSTTPPRRWGGNIDCKELVAGSTLYLPIPLDGALLMAGDGHGAQGDGEISGTAIECPLERATLTLDVTDRELRSPIARTADAWLAFGFDRDLGAAADQAIETMLDLMEVEFGLRRPEARALASVSVDLHVTQVVNDVKGVHAILRGVSYEFKLPDLGEGLTEGEIARWLVEEGQEIAEDAPLVEIATDKTTVEIPSPAAGLVSRILVEEGAVVPVGTVLVVIGGDGSELAPADVEQPRAEPAPQQKATSNSLLQGEKVRATPLIRKVAAELGVDLASVSGTGPQGRITEEDVRNATAGSDPGVAAHGTEGTHVQLRGVKRQMFEHLTRAHEIPAVTWVEECDFTGVDLKRLIPLVLQAVVEALKEFPELNARVENGDLVLLDRYDLGIAVQTEQGLVVPVVHGADGLSLDELDAEVRRLAEAAQAGTLKPEELRGGTFTITSAGKAAGLFVTPLINHPEVAILGIHRIEQRAVVREGEIVARTMGNLSVTFDHRVIDGKRAADFGLAVIARLQAG